MTLENCKRLLKHYEDLAEGRIVPPRGHKHWHDVVANAKVRAEAMRERVEHKSKLPKYAHLLKENKPKGKADGKKSA